MTMELMNELWNALAPYGNMATAVLELSMFLVAGGILAAASIVIAPLARLFVFVTNKIAERRFKANKA